MSFLKLVSLRRIGTGNADVTFQMKRYFIRKELLELHRNEWFFDHPKIDKLVNDLIVHCKTCNECYVIEHILNVLSKSEYDKESEVRSVVLLVKRVIVEH